ncbi:MAG: HAMP domain-containing histidine kinase [Myxococcales bacterium]|nr:HAMP domain-containing histidine kinase [Myxococcales bacterium]
MQAVARRRTLLLAGRKPLLASVGDWLIGLRWFAVFGMLGTTVVARRVLPQLSLTPVLFVLLGIGSLNLLWILLVRRRRPMLAPQIAADVVTLGIALFYTGGVDNPFAVFLTFQVAMAAMLCGRTAGLGIALLAAAVAIALSFAPPLPWWSAVVPVAQLQRVGHLCALIGVAAFVGLSAFVWRQRLEGLRTESDRNQRFALLGRLMGGMAHELNTPLATIVVASDELVAAGREAGSAEIEELSRTISQEAKRASNIISLLRGQLRDVTRDEIVDVSRVLEETVPRELAVCGFDGEVSLDVPTGLYAVTIPTGLRQILANVLKNAAEATLGVEAPRIRVEAEVLSRRVVIRVRDNGLGIRPDELHHIGEPFMTTKESTGGTGLGLYVSSLLAEQMQAVLQIAAEEEGTSVTLSLRAADAEGNVAASERMTDA